MFCADFCSGLLSRSSLASLDFEGNHVKTAGDTEISDILSTDPIIECLNLADNNLTDTDMTRIITSLKQHLGNEFELERNVAAYAALRRLIFDRTSLNAVSDSNPTCMVNGLCSSLNEGVAQLLSLRHDQGSNARHFGLDMDDDWLKLAPKVLASVQMYANYYTFPVVDPHPLSIVYEILKMPDLFESRVSR